MSGRAIFLTEAGSLLRAECVPPETRSYFMFSTGDKTARMMPAMSIATPIDDDRAEDGDGVRKAAAAHAGRAERGGDDVPGAVIPDRAASRKVGEAAVSAEGSMPVLRKNERSMLGIERRARPPDHDKPSPASAVYAAEPAIAPDEPPDHAGDGFDPVGALRRGHRRGRDLRFRECLRFRLALRATRSIVVKRSGEQDELRSSARTRRSPIC